MSLPGSSFNAQPTGDRLVAASDVNRRPSGLTAICVIAMVLGGLGFVSSAVGLFSLAAKPWMRRAMSVQTAGQNERVKEAQLQMQREIEKVTDRYQGFTLGSTVVNLFLGGAIFAGGLMVLWIKPRARRLLMSAFTVAIVFEILRAVIQVFMQLEMADVMFSSMTQMMEAGAPKGGAGAQAAAFTATLTRVGVLLVLAMSLLFGVAKVVFYAIGTSYLRRPNIRRQFGATGN